MLDETRPTRAAELTWREKYIARMVQRGITAADATACCNAVGFGAGGHDLSQDPEEAADAELEQWTADE